MHSVVSQRWITPPRLWRVVRGQVVAGLDSVGQLVGAWLHSTVCQGCKQSICERSAHPPGRHLAELAVFLGEVGVGAHVAHPLPELAQRARPLRLALCRWTAHNTPVSTAGRTLDSVLAGVEHLRVNMHAAPTPKHQYETHPNTQTVRMTTGRRNCIKRCCADHAAVAPY